MTEGLIKALGKFALEEKNKDQANVIANELLSIFSLSYSRFL